MFLFFMMFLSLLSMTAVAQSDSPVKAVDEPIAAETPYDVVEAQFEDVRLLLATARAGKHRSRARCLRSTARQLRSHRYSAALVTADLKHLGEAGYPKDGEQLEHSLRVIALSAADVYNNAVACGDRSYLGGWGVVASSRW